MDLNFLLYKTFHIRLTQDCRRAKLDFLFCVIYFILCYLFCVYFNLYFVKQIFSQNLPRCRQQSVYYISQSWH